MEALDSERLEAILDLLVRAGVEEFEGFGFHVRFTPNMFTPDKQIRPEEVMEHSVPEPTPESVWRVPELWPGGVPPSFPKK